MGDRKRKKGWQDWIDVAALALVEDGVVGVKVERLARRVGLTRGSFYYHFTDHDDLLGQLLEHWDATCRFLPDRAMPSNASEALAWRDHLARWLIEANGYDHRFDLAVRDWGRSDRRVEWAVERADRERIATLRRLFLAWGYDEASALMRARLFYYHQIGYYAIGVRQSAAERRRSLGIYLDIFWGAERLDTPLPANAVALLPMEGRIDPGRR